MSLYLKYRPKDFSSLVGQNFIRDTLRNAVSQNKLVWAYLFTWPRGTGKTSSARIFALAINCLSPKNGDPCFDCSICKSFTEGKLIDIIEIDAASNTWVDNVREIIEKAQFTPNKAKYKVYIIDEVHMLSKGAFNALLKILEEPPSHVKFILATTEIQKVPETILSRCQRYDFRSIDEQDIKNRLTYIAKEETIEVDEKSLEYITQNAAGGLRNAINMFEQLVFNGKIEFSYLIEHLWVTQKEKLEIFYSKLLNKDMSVLGDLDELQQTGKNIKLFFKDLLFYIKESILTQVKKWDLSQDSIYVLETLDETYGKTKFSLDDSITFTTWILKILSGSQRAIQQIPQQNNQTQPTQKKEVIRPVTEEKKENISPDDIEELFSQKSDTPKQNTPAPIDGEVFDKERICQVLKNLWASWWLLASLRESELFLQNGGVSIQPKNKFSKLSIDKSENIALIQKWLEEMWIQSNTINFI